MSSPRTNRREFLERTIALGATCVAYRLAAPLSAYEPTTMCSPLVKAAKPYVRKNLSVFVKDTTMLQAFRKGVECMRKLAPDHPFSWIFQANIHQRPTFPDYVYKQAASSTDPAQQLFRDDLGFTPSPNVFGQCTHSNWWFVAWHRAYVFYFERILRWASGEPLFALPYWNYADSTQRFIPQAFRDPMADGKPNPLYLPNSATFQDDAKMSQEFPMRNPDMNAGKDPLSEDAVSLCPLACTSFWNSPAAGGSSCFGGQRALTPGSRVGEGALETTHDKVHTAIGSVLIPVVIPTTGQVFWGFMHDPETAARDPIFWMHHCNIDRLWASWLALNATRANPLDSEWLDQAFTFYDVDKGEPKPVTVRVCQLLDTRSQLGYEYDSLSTDLTGCSPPAPSGAEIVRRLASRPERTQPDRPSVQLKDAEDQSFAIPLLAGVNAQEIQALAGALLREPKGGLALSLERIELKGRPGVYYDMYLNLPEGVKPSSADPHYVGSITFFGMVHHGAGHGGATPPVYLRFAFPQALLRLITEKKVDVGKLMLTFSPQTGKKSVGGAQLKPRKERSPVSIGRVQILQMR